MTARFTVLASGSSGNAALLEADGFGLLIDCGLAPRYLAGRFAAVGASWDKVDAVVITHTHTDHWKDLNFAECTRKRVPVYAHPAQFDHLKGVAESFEPLRAAGLAREYAAGQPIALAPGLTCKPVRVSHDADPTFAFRIDFDDGGSGPAWSVGYASDLGVGSDELVAAFAGVDVLALEYNHDEKMERNSSRPWHLVQRVLGDKGHLSNSQAADLTRAVAAASGPGFPSHLVQLHLSRDCNHPHLAECAGRAALTALNPAASVITAKQDTPARTVFLSRRPDAATRAVPRESRRPVPQPTLPGFEVA